MENRRLKDKIKIDELEAKLSEAKATLTKLQARKSPDCQQITPQCRPDQQPVETTLKNSNQNFYGEFKISLTKVNGSLGFTLRQTDDTVLKHTIKALVKEPAISDGRLRPGDKLVSCNGVDLSSFSHQELITFLRQSPEINSLTLYRESQSRSDQQQATPQSRSDQQQATPQSRPDQQQVTPQSRPDQQQANLYSCKVLLSGVPWTLTEKCLVRAFKRYGNIQIEWPSRRRSPSSSRDDLHIIFSSADVVTGFLSECTSRGGSWYYRITR